MSRFRTSSKYKHAVGTLSKREEWYLDLRPSTSAYDAQCIAASQNHVAIVWDSGNAVAVLRTNQIGKQKGEPSKIHAHSSQIYDLQFSPFDDNLLATGADDGRLRLWNLPQDGLTSDLSSPSLDLQEHRKRVAALRFHPTANNILLSGGNDSQAIIWDLENSKSVLTSNLDGYIQGLSWNYDGSLFAATTAEKTVSVWDPRSSQDSAVQTGKGHPGVKPTRVVWAGNGTNFISTGFSQTRERQVKVWDSRNLASCLQTISIDTSTGILEPFFDVDTDLLYLAGKGDGNIRCYESNNSSPYLSEITQFVSDLPTKSACLAPKRSVDVMNCEINRVLKLTSNSIAPVSWTVPRKSKVNFADDLFPNTAGTQPAQSGSDWLSGSNANPILVSLNPETLGITEERQEEIKQEEEEQQRIEEERIAKANKKELPKLNIVRSSKYRHVAGKLAQRNQFFENVKADNSSSETDSIKANKKWFAVPWKGMGLVGVFDIKKPLRISDTPGLIECGSNQLDMDWNPFNDDILATGLENAKIKIWKIPEGLSTMKSNYFDESVALSGHYSKVTVTKFHPVASNVLASASYDMTVKFWDIEKANNVSTFEGHPEYIQDFTWDYNGSRFATSCKDKHIRICDPHSGNIIASAKGHLGSKATKVTWMGNQDKLISVGFSKSSERQFSVWDVRNFTEPLGTTTIDTASGVIKPYYDEGTGILYILGKGDGTISYYEIVDEAPYAHLLSKFQTSDPQVGVAVLPKRDVNVKKVEIASMLKLTTKNVQPLSFTVPRTRKEFFQDDVFPPCPSDKPVLTADEWFSGKDAERPLMSLKPADMTNLSEAPAIERESKYDFDAEQAKRGSGPVTKEQVMDGFFDKVTSDWKEGDVVVPVGASYDERNDMVDEDEWSD